MHEATRRLLPRWLPLESRQKAKQQHYEPFREGAALEAQVMRQLIEEQREERAEEGQTKRLLFLLFPFLCFPFVLRLLFLFFRRQPVLGEEDQAVEGRGLHVATQREASVGESAPGKSHGLGAGGGEEKAKSGFRRGPDPIATELAGQESDEASPEGRSQRRGQALEELVQPLESEAAEEAEKGKRLLTLKLR
jgi:hypothetical protein